MDKPQGYEAIEKFLTEGQINPDNFRLAFGPKYNGERNEAYPARISFEYEWDTIFDWDKVSWGDARVATYLYLVAVYYPKLAEAYEKMESEKARLSRRTHDLERELQNAKDALRAMDARLSELLKEPGES